jgi:hypothetical protein
LTKTFAYDAKLKSAGLDPVIYVTPGEEKPTELRIRCGMQVEEVRISYSSLTPEYGNVRKPMKMYGNIRKIFP